jgi:hypothetical protein
VPAIRTPPALPAPTATIGQVVDPAAITPWHRGRILRDMVADTRRVVRKLRRQGYSDGPTNVRRTLPSFNKDQIRAQMRMVDEADRIEIAGVAPRLGLVIGYVANACYLPDITYACHLVFHRTDAEGRHLVYVHPHPVLLARERRAR